MGIGFAIPANMVRSVLSGITTSGRIVRPWIGAEGQIVTQDIALSMGLRRPVGVLISKIFPGGPANRAGIRIGDIITAVNGREINDLEALKFRIATRPIGDGAIMDLLGRVRPAV